MRGFGGGGGGMERGEEGEWNVKSQESTVERRTSGQSGQSRNSSLTRVHVSGQTLALQSHPSNPSYMLSTDREHLEQADTLLLALHASRKRVYLPVQVLDLLLAVCVPPVQLLVVDLEASVLALAAQEA